MLVERGRLVPSVVHPVHRPCCFDPVEDRAGGVTLQLGALLAAAGGVGLGEAEACDRRLVRGADVVPESYGVGEGLLRSGRVALGVLHPSSSERGTGDEGLALEASRDEFQLLGGGSGPVDVPDGDLDLDLRLEQRRPLQRSVRWAFLGGHPHRALERIPNGGGRSVRVALGQSHQRENRLGVPPGAVCRQQRLLRSGEVSLVQSDPAELVQRPPELPSQVETQLVAGHQGLVLRLVVRTAQPEDLRTVDPAAAMEAPDGACLAPTLHRVSPLLSHLVLGETLQRAHELAEDDPRRERIELPGHGCDPSLVEQRQPLLHVAIEDEQSGLCHPSDGARRRIPHRTDVDGTPGPLVRTRRVTSQDPLVGPHHREPSVRGRVLLAVEQSLGACQPPPHGCHEGGVEEQMHRQANGRTCRRNLLPGLRARGIGALPRLDGHIEMTGGVGDLSQNRQIGGADQAVGVRAHEEVEGLLPFPCRCRVSSTLDGGRTTTIGHRTPPYLRELPRYQCCLRISGEGTKPPTQS